MSEFPAVHVITTLLTLPGGEALVLVLGGLLLALASWALVLHREIGRRRRIDTALRADQDRLRQLLVAVCDAPWELDAVSGACIHPEAWRELLGYGLREGADSPAFTEIVHPDDRPRLQAALEAVLHGRAPALQESLRLRHASGTWVHVLVRGRPTQFDSQGGVLRISGGLIRLDERHPHPPALLVLLQRLETILATLPLHLYWTDETLHRTGNDACTRHLATLREAGFRLDELDAQLLRLEQQVLANHAPVQETIVLQHPESGNTRTLQLHLIPLPSPGAQGNQPGEIQGILGLCQDTTERTALEQRLYAAKQQADEASQAKSRFLAAMSHEIRTPMNAILGMAEMLRESRLDQEQEGFVRVLSTSGEALMSIINNILDLSRAESGQVQVERTPFRPARLLMQLRELFALRCKAKQLALEVVLDPALPEQLLGDSLRLQQVLTNLLDNAIKFTPQGSIRLQATLVRQSLQTVETLFEVTDTGPGIPEAKQEAVFERFVQADATTTRQYGGSGLGLALCRELVRLMGGRIWVESEPGQGSTFFVSIPFELSAATDTEALSPAHHPEAAASTTDSPCHVLLVEDSEFNAFVVASYLKGTNCRVTLARNGEEGLKTFGESRFDLVLMDMQMPVMDGYSATRAIRHLEVAEGLPATPILAMTAHALAEERDKTLAAGCTAHLAKPVSRQVLLEAIATHAGKRVRRSEPTAPPPELFATPSACPPSPSDVASQDDSPLPICVDPELKALAPTFLQAIRSKIAPFRGALTARDMEPLALLGHQLKGEGAAFGFPPLGELGAQLEQAARQGDAALVATLLARLQRMLDRIVVV